MGAANAVVAKADQRLAAFQLVDLLGDLAHRYGDDLGGWQRDGGQRDLPRFPHVQQHGAGVGSEEAAQFSDLKFIHS